MKINYEKFFIACARAKTTMTQAVNDAGLATGVLSKIKHQNSVNALTVGKLAAVLNVDAAELLEREEKHL